MKRVPLWLTIVPLLVAVAGYWYVWTGYKNGFRTEIARVLPGEKISIGGFPYRMEAEVASSRYAAGGRSGEPGILATAASAVLNRGPWQRDLTIIRAVSPQVSGSIPELAAASFSIRAPSAEMSLHLQEDRRIARLSTVFSNAVLTTALLGVPLSAAKLEVHFRETPGRSPEAWSPTLPERAQVVLAGDGLRTAGGAPLTLAADFRVTGPTRLVSYAAWAGTGTVEVHGLTLSDKAGEVLRLDGTMVADKGTPRFNGTVVTQCPQTVRGALTGERVSEQRLRLAATLTLSGSPGAWQLGGLPVPGRAVRAQQPPCPVLR